MISFDFPSSLPIRDVRFSRSENANPLFTDDVLDWLKETNLNVFIEGTLYNSNGELIDYLTPALEMTTYGFAMTLISRCKLVFENEEDAMLFKLTWC